MTRTTLLALAGRCATCGSGRLFTPRPDEIERYGVDVMGCNRRGFEGYTEKAGTCEAHWTPALRAIAGSLTE